MEESRVLQYINQDSFVHRMDSLSKFFWVLLVAVGMLMFRSLLSGIVMLALVFVVALVGARIPPRQILRSSPVIFGVGFLLGIFHSVVQDGDPILTLGFITVTDNGLIIGASYFLRISVVVLASYLMVWTTDIQQLMAGLVKIGIPYKFAFGLFTSLRFLPIIQREVDAVKAAHSIRGRVKQSQFARRFQLWQRYVFTIMVNGLRKAESSATAAELRGFGSTKTRSFYKPFYWSTTGVGMLCFFFVIITTLIVAERMGLANFLPSLTGDISTF
jgi:energy-coupling factor transport system permease protein